MAIVRVLIMDGKLVQGDAEFVLTHQDGSPVEPFNYRGLAELSNNYLAFESGINVHAFLVGTMTPESAAYFAGKLHAESQKRRVMPKRAETDRYFYFGWVDKWKEKRGAK